MPWNCLPPLLVVAEIRTPGLRPCSALKTEFCNLNSPMASRLICVNWPSLAPTSVLIVPSR